MNISEQIRNKRKEKKLTIQQIADRANVAVMSIYNAEHDKQITLATLSKICEVLELKIELNESR